MTKVKVIKDENAILPEYESQGAAGMDVKANIHEELVITPGARMMIPTGLKPQIQEGYEIQVRPRSGLAWKHGITVVNSPGTIDSDFRGEIKVILINHGSDDFIVKPQDRIGQLVLAKHERIEWVQSETLEETARGEGGFGSTNKEQ